MVFDVSLKTDKVVESTKVKAMEELNEFFGTGWVHNTPHIFLIRDRKTVNSLKGRETGSGVIGFPHGRDIWLLDPKSYSTDSSYEYKEEDFVKLVKHELCHLFINKITKADVLKPLWLIEGACVYISGQHKRYEETPIIKTFLDFYDFKDKPNYKEAGFAVKFLIERYGRKKFLKLLELLKNYQTRDKFRQLFKKIYGFELDYENFKE